MFGERFLEARLAGADAVHDLRRELGAHEADSAVGHAAMSSECRPPPMQT